MKRDLVLFAAIVVSALIIPAAARAATFTATLNQSALTSGTSNLLVNFTISNPSAGIGQVMITIPSQVTYSSPDGLTNNGNGTWSTSMLPTTAYWYNATASPTIASGASASFWFRLTTSTVSGSYNFNVSTNDSSGIYVSENVTVSISDLTPPGFIANTTSPSTPQYGPSKNYTFNATCPDNVAVAWVKFEWNGAINYTNYGGGALSNVSNQSLDGYGITLSDLLPGNYTWKWFAGDSFNESTGGLGVYNVTKAYNPMTMYFNGNAATGYTINWGNPINVTGVGQSVTLYTNVTGGGMQPGINPYTSSSLPIGSYSFTMNSTGNANYSANVTCCTYILRVRAPPPSYSVSTTIPTTWYLNAFALFNITWSDLNDATAFSVALLQHNATGTATNYTMTRITGTNKSTYALNATQPMVLSWRVFANNSAGSWNATTLTESTVAKITPGLALSVVPSWSVLRGVQTSVACTSDAGGATIYLYRNGVAMSNPDIQTLATSDYVYWCNTSTTANYSSSSVTNMLRVLSYAADISFTKADTLVAVTRESTNGTVVVVKNVGNASQPMNITVDNITSSWYTINATSATVASGYSAAFLVNFTPPASAAIADYAGTFRAMTTNRSITSGFVLRVMPAVGDVAAISTQLSDYRASVDSLLTDIREMKADAGLTNQTSSEQKAAEAGQKLDQAAQAIASGDYFGAQQLLDAAQALIAGAESDLAAEKQASASQIQQAQATEWTTWIVAAVVAIAVLVLAFLLWPGRGYSARTGSYTFKSPAEKGKQAVGDMKDRLDSLADKLPGMKKSFAPQKMQPQQQLQQPSFQPDVFAPKSVDYSFKPKHMIPVAGRFAAQPQPPQMVKQPFLESVARKLSQLKDMLKGRKEEVEIRER